MAVNLTLIFSMERRMHQATVLYIRCDIMWPASNAAIVKLVAHFAAVATVEYTEFLDWRSDVAFHLQPYSSIHAWLLISSCVHPWMCRTDAVYIYVKAKWRHSTATAEV